MPPVDDRIVSVSFENTKFEANVAKTMGSLSKLDSALKNLGNTTGFSKIEAESQKVHLTAPMSALDKLRTKLGTAGTGAAPAFSQIDQAGNKVTLEGPGRAVDRLQGKMDHLSAGTTFSDITKAADQTDLSGLGKAIDNLGNKFGVLQGAASVALGNVAAQAATKGAGFAKSFGFGPISQGFQEYQTNLQSIQTILANTQDSGGNLKTVNAALDELNKYSDQTIYNFSEMAKNIGTFTAAGVQLKPATAAIKGIANLAALSGSNSQQASTAMYQLSQAIAAGKVGLQDWNSVNNAGMGGAVFQKALARTAENMGTLGKNTVQVAKDTGKLSINGESFRNSIMAKPGEESWLTSDVLTQTLSQLTGDMTDAQLAAKGFNDEQIDAIQRTAKTAKLAATEVKTLPQVFDVARETIGSGWSATFRSIFGDFGEAKKTFTSLSNTINGFINTNADARNKVIGEWKKLGGRKQLIEGIKNAFEALQSVIGPIRLAFRDIFPAKTGKDLYDLTIRFRDLMKSIKLDPAAMENIRKLFRGVFAVFHIGITIIGDVITMLGHLFGAFSNAGSGSGGVLNFAGTIGDLVVSFDEMLTKGGLLKTFFGTLEAVLKVPLTLIKEIGHAIGSMFTGAESGRADGVKKAMEGVSDSLKPLKRVLDDVATGWRVMAGKAKGFIDFITPIQDNTLGFIRDFGKKIGEEFGKIDWNQALDAFSTGLVAGIFVKLRNTLTGGVKIDIGGGILKDLNETLKVTNANLASMQHTLQAATLLEIATAIAMLAAGILVLSKIDGKKLNRSMGAVAIGLGELVAAVAILAISTKSLSGLGLMVIAASLIAVASAIFILSLAFRIMATMSWEELAKGLAGVAGGLVAIGLATMLINPGLTLAAAASLIPMALGMVLLASAMKMLSDLSWEDLLQGLFGLAESLGALALGMTVMPVKTIAAIGPGLIMVGVGLTLIAGAVRAFGSMDVYVLAQGIVAVGLALALIGEAIRLIPPTLAAQAAGLIVLGVALTILAGAMTIFGKMGVEELVKSLFAIAGALMVIGPALIFMETTLPGSAALLAAAVAFAILGPALVVLGHIKLMTLIKGLGAMAAILGVLALVGAVAATPLTALALALAALGGAMLLGSLAFFVFAAGLAKLGVQGPKALTALTAAMVGFVMILPKLIGAMLNTILDALEGVAALLPKIILALGLVLDGIIAWVIRSVPNLAIAIGTLVDGILQVLLQNTPKLIAAGAKLMLDILTGLAQNAPQIVLKATEAVTHFLAALAANAPRIVAAGAATIVAYLQGIRDHIPELGAAVGDIVVAFVTEIGKQGYRLIATAGTMMTMFITAIGGYLGRMVSAGTNAIVSLLTGIGNAGPRIVTAGVRAASRFIRAVANGLLGLVDVGFHAIIDFLNGLADAIRENDEQLIDAGANLADAIIDGFVMAAGRLAGPLRRVVEGLFAPLPGWAKRLLGIHSPSTVFAEIGKNTMLGMAKGMSDNGKHAVRQMGSTTADILDTARKNMSKVPSALDGIIDADPVITPVLDLSNVHKEAQNMPDLGSNVIPITSAASFQQASSISQESQAAAAEQVTAQAPVTLHFEQNNTSPEAISDIELYRRTSNQLAQAKDAVGLAVKP